MNSSFLKGLCLGVAALMASQSFALPFEQVSREELYTHFFNIQSDDECKENTSCRMLRRHLIRDTNNCEMNPMDVDIASNYVQADSRDPMDISGAIRYLGVAPGTYGYDTFVDPTGTLVIESRMHFSNLDDYSAAQIQSMQSKMNRAAEKWTSNNTYSDYPVRFSLKITKNRSDAHISAKLKRKFTRGPYFSKWSLSWTTSTVAHEFGHLLGLDDEYSNNPFGGSMKNCSHSSIMCNSNRGRVQNYHYYLIFRRLLCKR